MITCGKGCKPRCETCQHGFTTEGTDLAFCTENGVGDFYSRKHACDAYACKNSVLKAKRLNTLLFINCSISLFFWAVVPVSVAFAIWKSMADYVYEDKLHNIKKCEE